MANGATTILSGVGRQSLGPRQITARKRLIVVAIAACFTSAPAWSNPTAPQVVNGSASFSQAGKLLTVNNSSGAIINWNSFSIGAGETTRFNQASTASSVMNRVIANDPSVLLGTLSSNGRVWLVNPAGIMVGQGARIDVAGFIASTLNVRNEDFLAGRLNFGATPNAGSIQNYGQISTPSGGSVYLVAPAVENHGIINAPNGEVILAAGQTAQLIDTGTPGVKVDITGAEGNVTNLGEIVAEAGRIGMAGVLVKNSGTLNASSLVKEGGRIFLRASKELTLHAASQIKADTGYAGNGGNISVWADDTVHVDGSISAKGGNQTGDGGFIETSGAHVKIADTARVSTLAPHGKTGTWLIDPNDFTIGGDMSGAAVASALDGTDFTIQTATMGTPGSGDIFVNEAVAKSGATDTTLTLSAERSIVVNAAIGSSSSKLHVNLHSDSGGVGSGAIAMNSGSSITSNGGNVVLAGGVGGTGYAIGTVSNPVGIRLDGATIDAGGGNIALRGIGVAESSYADGIYATNASLIQTAGAGTITLNGTGGAGTDSNVGVHLGTNASISSFDGAIAITGQGAGSGASNYGVYISSGATVSATGTGTITLNGTGSAAGIAGVNTGISVSALDGPTRISTAGGAISMTGTGGYGGNGIDILDGAVIQSDTGGITIDGTGCSTGASIGYCAGTWVAGAQISTGGNISITGNLLDTVSEYNTGLSIEDAAAVWTTGVGSITLTGTGGSGTNDNYGVFLNGDVSITTNGGSISLTGTGGNGTTGWNVGVSLAGVSVLTGGGALTITGTGGGTGSDNYGVRTNNTILDSSNGSTGGAITLTGTGGNGASSNFGVYLESGTSVLSGGDIILTGHAGGGTGDGIKVLGNLVLRADKDGTGIGTVGFDDSDNVWISNGHTDIYYNPLSYADPDTKSDGLTNPYSTIINSSGGTYTAWMLVNDVGQESGGTRGLQAVNTNLAGNYALGKNIDASATATWNWDGSIYNGFMPVGGGTTHFTGNFDGLNHTINNLVIYRPYMDYVGLFGYVDSPSTISNVGLANVNVTGGVLVGALVGEKWSGTTINNAYSTGSVESVSSGSPYPNSIVGGLVGRNQGIISNSYSTASATGNYDNAGGLVGVNDPGATIRNSYSTGAAHGNWNVGGLVGTNYGTIEYSYSTGSATTGTGSNIGGLVGNSISGTVTRSYWDTVTSGLGTSGGGGDPLPATGQMNQASYTGFDFTSSTPVWWMSEGNTRPFLRSEHSTTINNSHQLQLMAMNPAASYKLANNIDMAELTRASGMWNTDPANNINGSTGFVPVGDATTKFTGQLDGLNHTITGLTMYRPTESNVGLLGYVGSGGLVKNVGLVSGSVTGSDYVGALVGRNAGSISNSYNNSVPVTGSGDYVGGLVGYNDVAGVISQSYSGSQVSDSGNIQYDIGGLVGHNGGSIEYSYSTGSVTVTGSGEDVGGLVGHNDVTGVIDNSHSSSSVDAPNAYYVGGLVGWQQSGGGISSSYSSGAVTGDQYVGGLVGYNNGSISNAYATGYVTSCYDGSCGNYVGGLVGYNYYYGTVSNSHATGDVTGNSYVGGLVGKNDNDDDINIVDTFASGIVTGISYVGGLVGYNSYGQIERSYATGDVIGAGTAIGGLIGYSNYTISNVYATGNVSVDNYANRVGGLVGYNDGDINNAYATGSVSSCWDGLCGSNVGGLVGYNADSVSYAYATGVVSGGGYAGGLIGYSSAAVSNAYATGSVSGTSSYVGGLIGSSNAAVNNAYATGGVSGTSSYVGGLIGSSSAAVNNVYATGSVVSSASSYVGGLMGQNLGGSVTNAYALGSVTGNSYTGGLVGQNMGGINFSYASGVVTATSDFGVLVGQNLGTVTSSVGKTAAEMTQLATFQTAGWNIDDAFGTGTIWRLYANNTTPLLRSFLKPLTATANAASRTFDGSAFSGGNGVSYSPVASPVVSGTLAYSGSSQGAVNAGSYAITPSGLFSTQQQGYDISFANGSLTIDPAIVSANSINLSGTRAYDGTVNVAADIFTLGGLVSGQDLTLTGVGTVADKNVSVNKPVNLGSLTLGNGASGLASNYTFAGGTQVATITPAPLTVGGLTAQNKVYDATAVATVSGTLTGVIAGDAVTLATPAATFNNKNVGSAKPVTVGTLTLAGADAGNYSVAPPTGATLAADITPASLTLSGLTAQNKVYDATTVATITGTAAFSGVLGTDVVMLGGNASGSFADKNVGIAKRVSVTGLSLGGTDAGNYALTSTSTISADITPASLTLSGLTAKNKVYDATTVATITGAAAFSGILGTDVVTLDGSASASFVDKNVGVAKTVSVTGLTLAGVDAGNYTLTNTSASTSADITPASLTLSGLAAQNKVYDATTVATIAGTAAFSGVLGTDVIALDGNATGNFADKNVGVAKPVNVTGLTLTGADAGNYMLNTTAASSADITARALNVTAAGVAKVYDGLTGAIVTYSDNRVAGDALTPSGSASHLDKNVGSAKTVSVNGIALTGTDAGNYTLGGTTAVTTADITVRPLSTWIGGASGNWSVASNWDALPDLSNVLAVSVPTGSVTYDAAAGGTNLASLTAAGLNIAGGSLSIADNLTVSSSFSQSGGALAFGGGANASITQASGNLNLPALTLASLSLAAPAGAITQSGAIIAAALNTQSQAGTTLTNSGNSVGSFTAANNGSGNVALTNTGALTITTITNTNGNISVDNAGAVTTVGAVSAPAGAVSILAHSPLNIGAAGVSASGAIALTAGATAGSGDTLTLTGPVSSTGSGGAIALFAGDDLVQNANVTTSGGAVSALSQTGNISMALGTTTSTGGGSIGYSASSGNVVLTSLNAGSGAIALNAGRGIQTAPGFSGANLIGGSAVIVSGGSANLNTQVRLLDVTVEGEFSVTDLLTGTVFTDVPAAAPLPILNQVVSTVVATTQQQPVQPTSQTTAPPPPPPPTTSGGSGPLLLSSTTQTIGGTADTFGGGSVVDSLPATSAGSSGGSSGTPASGQGDKPATDKPVADKSASAKADEKKDDKKDDDKKKDEEPKAKKEDRPVAKKLPTCGR